VYYFATKDQLILEVLEQLGLRLMTALERAFGDAALAPDELLQRSWPALANTRTDAVFAVFLAATGQAVTGQEPYVNVVKNLMRVWQAWLESRIAAPDPRGEALRIMVIVDGLMMVRLTSGPRAAGQAAAGLGIDASTADDDNRGGAMRQRLGENLSFVRQDRDHHTSFFHSCDTSTPNGSKQRSVTVLVDQHINGVFHRKIKRRAFE
jgi:AcrR family transcriptional regulator